MWELDTTFPGSRCAIDSSNEIPEADQNLQPYILPVVAAAPLLLVVTAI